MKRLYSLILWVALTALAAPLHAVTKYSCDFETEAARNRWVLTPVANPNVDAMIANKWYIGESGNNSPQGENGLFISNNEGQSAQYQATSCWVYAYDTISLDPIAGDYTVYFDYCVMANMASKFDGLYMLWVPMDVTLLSIPTSSGTIPDECLDYVIRLQPNSNIDYLSGTATWKQCLTKIPGSKCDGTPHRLVFVWTNGSNLPQQPAAKVDNIIITDVPPCDAPTNVVITPNGSSISVEWTGTATSYEVSAYSYDGESWAGPKIVTGNQTNFTGIAVGQTDFIIRAICDDVSFSLKTITSKLIYYPDQMCVDYLNLDNAVCYINNSSPSRSDNFNDFIRVAPVDRGASNIASRHVVHFDRTETEPRTGGLAKTIPDGELASIRLGNWDSGDQAERIEFTFPVDTVKYPVLLLKYMPLLEAPGHADYENPRFLLDMLVGGVSIGRCGMADFNANDVEGNGPDGLSPAAIAQGWHRTAASISQTSDDIIWKEWTTVGVNLRKKEYQGKQLTVRLTTHDCTFSVHSGYAYFTLGCSDGKLKDMKCGQINPEFKAPDGFAYRWAYAYNEKYRRADGSFPEKYVVSREQNFNAGMQDDSLYVVDCMFVQDTTCYFSLYASTLATNPVSEMSKPKIMKNCRENTYKVKFDGSPSWVKEVDHVLDSTYASKNYHIETYEWTVSGIPYGWSDEVSPTFDFPIEGGDFDVTLRTTCGSCEDVLHYPLHLDPLGETRDTITTVLCDIDRKAGYMWAEKPDTLYYAYGLDSVVYLNEATSCDSIIYLNLIEPVRIYEDTMVMQTSLPFNYHGRIYPEGTVSMVDTVPVHCDTTYVLNLEVYEPLGATIAQKDFVLCEGDDLITLVYDITRGRSLRYSYSFNDPLLPDTLVHQVQKKGQYSLAIAIDPNIYPNVYTGSLLLEDSLPECNIVFPITITVNYASTIIAQRWNDVLAIRNSTFNGGYEFDSVQWYVEGSPIVGATEFTYYTAGTSLQFGKPYTALLTRKDGVRLFTCPVYPAPVAASVTDMPSLVPPAAQIALQGSGVASWYDVLGHLYQSEAYNESSVTAPSRPGFYLLVTQGTESRATHRILVK